MSLGLHIRDASFCSAPCGHRPERNGILSKDLNGTIRSRNNGAERLFGYTAEEAGGKPVTMLITPDLQNEEPEILERIKRGPRLDYYETVRQRQHGSLIDISLPVSPIRNAQVKSPARQKSLVTSPAESVQRRLPNGSL